jgi:hypothetical protein
MPNSLEQQRLLDMLHDNEVLRERGYDFSILGGVLVERDGHARGVWRCGPRGFSWTPAGYNEPKEWVADAEQALRYTLLVLVGGVD